MHRVAIVVSSVGYHWEELFGGYFGFEEAGFAIDLFTCDGSPPKADPMSLRRTGPGAAIGLGVPARIAPDTPRGRALSAALEHVRGVASLEPSRYDALYLPGGHGCLFDVNTCAPLHDAVRALRANGAILAAVCHATSTFARVREGGRSLAHGHALTGFPHPLDRALIRMGLVDRAFLPLPLVNDDELRRAGVDLRPVDVMKALLNPQYVRVSLPFVTGVGPKAASKVAKLAASAVLGRTHERSVPSSRAHAPS